MNPTLYLTNWSSPKLHGPGRKFTIMARPRAWEHGIGRCRKLTPMDETDLMREALRTRAPEAVAAYRGALERRWEADLYGMRPGLLVATNMGDAAGYVIKDDDTLCCACAKGAECHRRWAAPFLVRAGWRVILDGAEVTP